MKIKTLIFSATALCMAIASVGISQERVSQVKAAADNNPGWCGNGFLSFMVEECDDGNKINGDGCSALCKVEDREPEVPACSDSQDNDSDGLLDAEDAGCHTDWNANNSASYDPAGRGEYEIGMISISSEETGQNNFAVPEIASGYTVSNDGRYGAFASYADNLVPGDTNGLPDIFVRDRLAGETTRVNVASDGTQANGLSASASISADGRFVAFVSAADNLVTGDTNGAYDIFLHDITNAETKRINVAPDGMEANDASSACSISADGNEVRFYSDATNLAADSPYGSFVYDRRSGSIAPILEPVDVPFSLSSADGKQWVYSSDNGSAASGYEEILVDNQETGKIERIGLAYDGSAPNGDSSYPSISMDGRYVVFASYASNLVAGDNNGREDVFVRDRFSGTTARVSRGINGEEGKQQSSSASLSANGKYILFNSSAWNLVPQDHNKAFDAFLVKNPLFVGEDPVQDSAPLPPSELRQRNESDGVEVGVGKIINEGAADSFDSIFLSAKVEDSDGSRVALEVQIESVDEVTGKWTSYAPIRSGYVESGETAVIEYHIPQGGLYTWRAKTIGESGKGSDFAHFGDNGIEADFISSNFSFVFLTDVHLGSLTTVSAAVFKENWFESQSYPRFTDVLYDIENLDPKPEFILIGGDNVEYNNIRWLRDFKSITEGFTERTGIDIYFVPGNHDRYDSESTAFELGEANLSGGNDYLKNYFEVMKNSPKGVTSIFEDDDSIMDDVISREGGYNKYNYYFNHKGIQFIGLDSGEDTGVWDQTPESEGLHADVLRELENIAIKDDSIPRVVFMHSTVRDDNESGEFDNNNIWDGVIVPDGAISNNWTKFITYCNERKVGLVLSGHTHDSMVFDLLGNEVKLPDWMRNESYPLYLQTQSATKKDNHGYRIIEVKNGKSIPREPVTSVKKYEKVFTDLDAGDNFESRIYDSDGNEIRADNNGEGAFFIPISDRKILYEDTRITRFEIKNNNPSEKGYSFRLQKRNEGGEPSALPVVVSAYLITNETERSWSNILGSVGSVVMQKSEKYITLEFKNINIDAGSVHTIEIEWGNLSDFDIRKVNFGIDGNFNSNYHWYNTWLAVDLNSPGELRVVDAAGHVTGLVDGEIIEDIPYSIYIPESETVYIFGNSIEDVKDLKTQVVGAYEATYDLSLSLSENDEEKAKFTADDILTNDETIHQFGVDWDALSQGENGVTMEFDENGDGVFEKAITSDGSLSFPEAVLNTIKYEANEGTEIIFDGSASTDADGSIALYEWDFNGDGIYDASSAEPTIAHTYGDDFSGKVFLRVTDNEELSDSSSIATAEVIIANVNPTALISGFEMADWKDRWSLKSNLDMEKILSEIRREGFGGFGPPRGKYSSDMPGRFVLEGAFLDSGYLDTHVVSIDWGDGALENISPITEENASPDATGNIKAMHRYAKLDNYVVKLTIEDDDGGKATAEITLESPRVMKQVVLSRLQDMQTNDRDIRKGLDKAIISLEESLKEKYWKDDFHLQPRHMGRYYTEETKVVNALDKISRDKKRRDESPSTTEIQKLLEELKQIDTYLARIMLYEAENDLKSAKKRVEEMLG